MPEKANTTAKQEPMVRWMAAMSVLRHTDEELTSARHAADLATGGDLVVHVDAAHRGVGTASCGPDVLERYRIPSGRYEWSFTVSSVR